MSMWEEIAKIIGGGGPLDQLPAERQGVRPGFGLEEASIEASDLSDQLRNAERKEGAIPMGPRSGPFAELMARQKAAELASLGKRLRSGLGAEEAAAAARRYAPIKNAKPMSEAEFEAWRERADPFWYRPAGRGR